MPPGSKDVLIRISAVDEFSKHIDEITKKIQNVVNASAKSATAPAAANATKSAKKAIEDRVKLQETELTQAEKIAAARIKLEAQVAAAMAKTAQANAKRVKAMKEEEAALQRIVTLRQRASGFTTSGPIRDTQAKALAMTEAARLSGPTAPLLLTKQITTSIDPTAQTKLREKVNQSIVKMDTKAAQQVKDVWERTDKALNVSSANFEKIKAKSNKTLERETNKTARRLRDINQDYYRRVADLQLRFENKSLSTAKDRVYALKRLESDLETAKIRLMRNTKTARDRLSQIERSEAEKVSNAKLSYERKLATETMKINTQIRKAHEDTAKRAEAEQKKSNAASALAWKKTGAVIGIVFKGIQVGAGVAFDAIGAYLSTLQKIAKAVVGTIASVGIAVGGVMGTLLNFVIKNTEEFNKFQISLEGAVKSTTQAGKLADFAQSLAIRTPVQFEQIQDIIKSFALIPATRFKLAGDIDEATRSIKGFTDVILGLAAIDPVQGVPGALFATREALSGNFRSIALRFEILPDVIAQSIGQSLDDLRGDPELTLKALKAFTSLFVGPDTIRKLGEMPGVLVANIHEGFQKALLRVGRAGVFDFFTKELRTFSDSISYYFDKEFGKSGMADKFATVAVSLLQTVTDAMKNSVTSLADLLFPKGDGPLIERALTGILAIFSAIEVKVSAISKFFSTNKEQFKQLGNLATGFVTTAAGAAMNLANQAGTAFLQGAGRNDLAKSSLIEKFTIIYVSSIKLAVNSLFGLARALLNLTPMVNSLGYYLGKITGADTLESEIAKRERQYAALKERSVNHPAAQGRENARVEAMRVGRELNLLKGSNSAKALSEIDRLQAGSNSIFDSFLSLALSGIQALGSNNPTETANRRAQAGKYAKSAALRPAAEDIFQFNRTLGIAVDALSSLETRAMEFADALGGSASDSMEIELAKLQANYSEKLPGAIKAMNASVEQTTQRFNENIAKLVADPQSGINVIGDIIESQRSALKDAIEQKAGPEEQQMHMEFIKMLEETADIIRKHGGYDAMKLIQDMWKSYGPDMLKRINTTELKAQMTSSMINSMVGSYNVMQNVNADRLSTEGEKFAASTRNQIATLQYQLSLAADPSKQKGLMASISRIPIFANMASVSPLGPLGDIIGNLGGLYGMTRTGFGRVGEFSQVGLQQSLNAIDQARAYVSGPGQEELSRYVNSFIELIDSFKKMNVEQYSQQVSNLIRSMEDEILVRQVPAAQAIIDELKKTNITDQASLKQGVKNVQQVTINGLMGFLDTLSKKVANDLQNSGFAFQVQRAENISSLSSLFMGSATTLSNRYQMDQGGNRLSRLLNDPFAFQSSGLTTAQLGTQVQAHYGQLQSNVARAADAERQRLRDTISDGDELKRKLDEVDTAASDLSMTLNEELSEALRNLPLDNVTGAIVDFSNTAGSAIKSGISDTLVSAMNGFSDLGDVGVAVLRNLQKSVADLATQLLVGDLGNLGSILTGRAPNNLGVMGGGLLGSLFGFGAFANGGVVTRPTLGLIGEGRSHEAVVPMPGGRIPLSVNNGNVYVSMPGRRVPTSIKPMADGYMVGTPSSNTANINNMGKPEVTVMIVNSEEELRRKFPEMVENAVVSSYSKKGKVYTMIRSAKK